jgi:hypothetical protein
VPAVGRDILAIEAVRKPALLRQVFAVAAGLEAVSWETFLLNGPPVRSAG